MPGLWRHQAARRGCEGAFMAGSWREILECAAADEAEAEAEESARPREAHPGAESLGGEPPAGSRGFDEPELTAFLTRLASPPAPDGDGPALSQRRQSVVREKAQGSLLEAVTAPAKAPAPSEAVKSAKPASPPPAPGARRPRRSVLAASLLAAAAGLSAFVLLIPDGKKPHAGQSPSVIEASRVRIETPSQSHGSRKLESRHKRSPASRAEALNRCGTDWDTPACRWRRYPDR